MADLDSKLIESDPKSFLKQVDSKIGFGTGTKRFQSRPDYGGYGEMAQKVIEGDMSHVKSYAGEIEMAQFQNGSKSDT